MLVKLLYLAILANNLKESRCILRRYRKRFEGGIVLLLLSHKAIRRE